jgi:hypothetical protein
MRNIQYLFQLGEYLRKYSSPLFMLFVGKNIKEGKCERNKMKEKRKERKLMLTG